MNFTLGNLTHTSLVTAGDEWVTIIMSLWGVVVFCVVAYHCFPKRTAIEPIRETTTRRGSRGEDVVDLTIRGVGSPPASPRDLD